MTTKKGKQGGADKLRESLIRSWGKEKFEAIMDSLNQLQRMGIDIKDLERDLDSFIKAHVKDREIFFSKDGL